MIEEIEARLKLTRAVMEAIRQGLTLDDIKKIFKTKCDHFPGRKSRFSTAGMPDGVGRLLSDGESYPD